MCTVTYVTAYDFLQKKIQIDIIYKYTTYSKILCYQSKKNKYFFNFLFLFYTASKKGSVSEILLRTPVLRTYFSIKRRRLGYQTFSDLVYLKLNENLLNGLNNLIN